MGLAFIFQSLFHTKCQNFCKEECFIHMNCLFTRVEKEIRKNFFYGLSYLQLDVSFGPFKKTEPGAHQMEHPSPLISWVNPFPSRVINRTIFVYNALESHECACCLLSFLNFHWPFPLSARETSPVNRSIYKSTRERVDCKGLCGRWRLHLMGSLTEQLSLCLQRARSTKRKQSDNPGRSLSNDGRI